MDLVTLSQIAAPILQTIFIAVIGLGYYTVRATWATVGEMRAEHAAGGGRPLITVSEDYANLPNMSLIVQNVEQGPAKDISFEFSEPVQSSDGFVYALSRRERATGGCTRALFWHVANGPSPGHRGSSVAVDVADLDRALNSYCARPLRLAGGATGALLR